MKTLRKRNALQRNPITLLIVALVLAALTLLGAGVSNAAAPEQNLLDAFRSGGDISKIAAMAMPETTPASSVIADIKPTPAALATRGPATYYVEGTGGGKNASAVQTDKGTYVLTPYAASILQGPVMGPYNFADSVEIGTAQALANASVNPQPVNKFEGHSQGEVAAWEAAARDGQASHITGTGSPTNPGTGFVNFMPDNLLFTNIGTPSDLQPGDRADLYNKSGDCWANMPSLLTPQSFPACIRSTADTHYGVENGYGNFREDTVYESSPGVFQHVQWSENGYVLWAQDLGIQLTEQQKQQVRDFAPQGRPGIQNGPTLREIFDPVSMVQNAVQGAVTPAPAAVTNDAPAAPANPVTALAEAAKPMVDQFVAQAPEPVQQIVEQVQQFIPAAQPVAESAYTAPAPVQDFVQNVQTQVQNVVSSFATPAVGNVNAAPAAPAMPALPDLGALAASVMGGV